MKKEIKTIKDILEVVNQENIEDFLIDFETFLTYATNAKKNMPEGLRLESIKFTWIDDGKHDKTIKIKILTP